MASTEARRFLTVQELAAYLRVSRRRAYELVNAGDVPSIRIGGSIRIPHAELERQLADAIGKPAA